MSPLSLLLTLAAALPSDPACPAGAAAIPFEWASPAAPLMVVEGRIDPLDTATIVFDTGASAPFPLFVSEDVAARLGLTLSEEIAPADSTAVGSRRQTYRTAVTPRFTLGPISLHEAQTAVTPVIDGMEAQIGRRIDAIVGHDLVKDRRVAIDFPARRIAFDAAVPDGEPLQAVYAERKPLLLVPTTINGRGPFWMELDTGASRTLLSPAAARRAGVRPRHAGRLMGAGGEVEVGVGAGEIGLGALRREATIAVTPEVDRIAEAAGAIDGVLGSDVFADACLTIDFPSRHVWVTVRP